MLWLGPPVGSNTCITQTLNVFTSGDPTTQMVGNNTYRLEIDYAFFDPNQATSPSGNSSLQIHYVLYDSNGDLDLSSYNYFPTDPGDPMTETRITGTLSPWATVGQDWTRASFDFVLPDMTGYSAIKFCFSAPMHLTGDPSKGVLLDSASLTVVPEPGSALLIGAVGLGAMLRRRRFRSPDLG
jgi:hypothetical protein